MSDFNRDPYKRSELESAQLARAERTGSGWGWILGVLFVVLIVGLVIAGSGNKEMADQTPVPNRTTTGQATPLSPAPSMAVRPNPATPPSTTGSGSSSMTPAPDSPSSTARPAGQSQ